MKARQSSCALNLPGSLKLFSGSPVRFAWLVGTSFLALRKFLSRSGATIACLFLCAAFVGFLDATVVSPVRSQDTANQLNNWERIGPAGGDVISLAACGTTVYLGAADGHVFASEDAGGHWELRGRAGTRFDAVMQTLLCDARNAKLLFAAVWFQDPAAGGGVFRSEDAGHTWALAGLEGEAVRALEQSRSQPDVLIAGTRAGVFRSSDAGQHWERISPPGDAEIRNIDSLALDPRDPCVIYAGTYHLPWKTLDGGKSWTPVSAGMIDDSDIMSMRLDSTNPARLFASACSGIYRSESAGAQWVKLQGIPYAARRTQTIVQNPFDAKTLYAGTTTGLWLTHDAGETWTRVTPPDWVINAVSVRAAPRGNSFRLLLGTEEQGVLSSDDDGRTFVPANTGFSHHVIADLAADPRDPRHLLARLAQQLLETRDAGKTWRSLPGGTPFAGATRLFGNGDGWWAALEGSGLARCDATTQKWQRILFTASPNISRQRPAKALGGSRGTPKEQKPEINSLFFVGSRVYAASSQGVWSGEVNGGRLQRFGEKTLTANVRALVVSSDGEEVAAVTPLKLFYTFDAAKSWRELDPPAKAGELFWLAFDPGEKPVPDASEKSSDWLVGTANGVYRVSSDSQIPWRLLQSGLPAGHALPPAFSTGTMAITMVSGGFYLTRDAAKTWERLDAAREASIFAGIVGDGHGGYFVASRSEGVLHFTTAVPKE